MNREEYEKRMDGLWKTWKSRSRHKDALLVKDGIVHPETWFDVKEKNQPRILFILKEAYGSEFSLADYILSTPKFESGMWYRVAEWAKGLIDTYNHEKCVYEWINDMPTARSLLKHVAIMNLRKSNGTSNSGNRDYIQYAKEDADLLKKQFDLINPTIVVYGYTFDACDSIHGLSAVKKKHPKMHQYYWDQEGRIHIDFYHPANHYPAILNYYGLTSIYHHALHNKTNGLIDT